MADRADHPGGRLPAVVTGRNGLDRLAEPGGPFGRTTAVIVADGAVVASGYAGRIQAALAALDVCHLHIVAPGEPTAQSVDDVAALVRAAGAPVVIGAGGGSALDTAKQAAAIAGAPHGIEHYALGANPLPVPAPVVAIPTTAGTGSEVTRTCIVSDAAGRKVWTWGDELLPVLVLLDPAATATLPPHLTAATGLDAFVHAVEAVTGRRSNAIVAGPALHAIRLVLEHLPAAVADGTDLEIRLAMQEAALLAGLAIDGGGTGIAHSIGHSLGTLTHVPHGVSVAVGLGAALAWNVAGAPEAFGTVADVIGRPVHELADAYRELLTACEFPAAVRLVGPLELEADELAATMIAVENRPMYDNNCRRADGAERVQLA
ncbi:MAG: iron-containing alcohol dehydrogenase, partial [Acidimicrobiia bacterium]|nr:iron-containing alcohol dehydrogenase [Acidimicrobiia bacterium]